MSTIIYLKFCVVATRNPRNEKVIAQFAFNVRKHRTAKDLTMIQLAELCEVEYGAISTIERGIVNCTISTAYAISKALGIKVDQLFE